MSFGPTIGPAPALDTPPARRAVLPRTANGAALFFLILTCFTCLAVCGRPEMFQAKDMIACILFFACTGSLLYFDLTAHAALRRRFWVWSPVIAAGAAITPYLFGAPYPLETYMGLAFWPGVVAHYIGMGLALVTSLAARLVSWPRDRADGPWGFLLTALPLITRVAVVAFGFFLLGPVLNFLGISFGAGPALRDAQAAIAAALIIICISQFIRRGRHSRLLGGKERLLFFGLCIIVIVLLNAYPPPYRVAEIGLTPLFAILAVLSFLGFCLRWPAAALISALAIVLIIPQMLMAVSSGPPAENGTVLLLGVFLFGLLLLDNELENASNARQRMARLIARYHALERAGGGQLLWVDLARKRIAPADPEHGAGPDLSFAEFFSGTSSANILDFIAGLKARPETKTAPPMVITLPADPFGRGAAKATRPENQYEVHILERGAQAAWIGLRDITGATEQEARAAHLEDRLTDALLREEHLMSVASHELRTPMAVLSMLGEELDAKASWPEIAPNFHKTLSRVIGLLDDLRLQNKGGAAQSVFLLRELGLHLQATFRGAVAANGITLRVSAPQNKDILLHSDYGHIFIALSKLIENAILHSKGSEIFLSVFLEGKGGDSCSVTWQVSDNGIGLEPDLSDQIFQPFNAAQAGRGEHRPGIGLYIARRAMRSMGGDLWLRPPGGRENSADDTGGETQKPVKSQRYQVDHSEAASLGTTFVMTHPARLAKSSKYVTLEEIPVTEPQASYPDKTVLLVEDNRVVGDIIATRLRRLFGTTIWAESADEALEAYAAHAPDMILMDQLLPGAFGSDLIRQIRSTNKAVPIIGITASTLGSECADLEAAGADYALEKPLSNIELRQITKEFFGPPPAEADPV